MAGTDRSANVPRIGIRNSNRNPGSTAASAAGPTVFASDPALAQAVLSSQGASLGLPNGVVVGEHDARRIQLLGDRFVSGVP
jgi:hypothetical protein